jgi:copper chaperone
MQEFHLPDMSCGHCVGVITKTIKAADAEAQLDFQLAQHDVKIASGKLGRDEIVALLSEAGYPPAQQAD